MLNIDAALPAKTPDSPLPSTPTVAVGDTDSAPFLEALACENQKLASSVEAASVVEAEDQTLDNAAEIVFALPAPDGLPTPAAPPAPQTETRGTRSEPLSPASWLLGLTWVEPAWQNLPRQEVPVQTEQTALTTLTTMPAPAPVSPVQTDKSAAPVTAVFDSPLPAAFKSASEKEAPVVPATPSELPVLFDSLPAAPEPAPLRVAGPVTPPKVEAIPVSARSAELAIPDEEARTVEKTSGQGNNIPETSEKVPSSASEPEHVPVSVEAPVLQSQPEAIEASPRPRKAAATRALTSKLDTLHVPAKRAERTEAPQSAKPIAFAPRVAERADIPSELRPAQAARPAPASVLENAGGPRPEIDGLAESGQTTAKKIAELLAPQSNAQNVEGAPSVIIPIDVPVETSGQESGGPHARSRDLEIQVMARSSISREPAVALGAPGDDVVLPGKHSVEPSADAGASLLAQELKGHAENPARAVEARVESPGSQWTQIEKSDVLSQLVEKARSFRWEKDSEIVVSLKPESLGRISMRASLVDRTMVATISAESDKVRHLIQLELPAIQKALHESGMVARVEVSQQDYLNFTQNSPGNGQPRFRQNAPAFVPEPKFSLPAPLPAGSPDSRYSSNAVHLIA